MQQHSPKRQVAAQLPLSYQQPGLSPGGQQMIGYNGGESARNMYGNGSQGEISRNTPGARRGSH